MQSPEGLEDSPFKAHFLSMLKVEFQLQSNVSFVSYLLICKSKKAKVFDPYRSFILDPRDYWDQMKYHSHRMVAILHFVLCLKNPLRLRPMPTTQLAPP